MAVTDFIVRFSNTGSGDKRPDNFSPLKTSIKIDENAIENTKTSLDLCGRSVLNSTNITNNNLIHLLENFCKNTEPRSPTEGQFWYDTSDKDIYHELGRLKIYLPQKQVDDSIANTFVDVAGTVIDIDGHLRHTGQIEGFPESDYNAIPQDQEHDKAFAPETDIYYRYLTTKRHCDENYYSGFYMQNPDDNSEAVFYSRSDRKIKFRVENNYFLPKDVKDYAALVPKKYVDDNYLYGVYNGDTDITTTAKPLAHTIFTIGDQLTKVNYTTKFAISLPKVAQDLLQVPTKGYVEDNFLYGRYADSNATFNVGDLVTRINYKTSLTISLPKVAQDLTTATDKKYVEDNFLYGRYADSNATFNIGNLVTKIVTGSGYTVSDSDSSALSTVKYVHDADVALDEKIKTAQKTADDALAAAGASGGGGGGGGGGSAAPTTAGVVTSDGTALAGTAYGTNKFLLASTGTGLTWVDPSTLGGSTTGSGSGSSGLNSSIMPSGYQIFPNGFMMQWGYEQVVAPNTGYALQNLSFPKSMSGLYSWTSSVRMPSTTTTGSIYGDSEFQICDEILNANGEITGVKYFRQVLSNYDGQEAGFYWTVYGNALAADIPTGSTSGGTGGTGGVSEGSTATKLYTYGASFTVPGTQNAEPTSPNQTITLNIPSTITAIDYEIRFGAVFLATTSKTAVKAKWIVKVNGTPVYTVASISTTGYRLIEPNYHSDEVHSFKYSAAASTTSTITVEMYAYVFYTGGIGFPVAYDVKQWVIADPLSAGGGTGGGSALTINSNAIAIHDPGSKLLSKTQSTEKSGSQQLLHDGTNAPYASLSAPTQLISLTIPAVTVDTLISITVGYDWSYTGSTAFCVPYIYLDINDNTIRKVNPSETFMITLVAGTSYTLNMMGQYTCALSGISTSTVSVSDMFIEVLAVGGTLTGAGGGTGGGLTAPTAGIVTSNGTTLTSTAYGTSNFLLASNGTGVTWVDPSTLGGGFTPPTAGLVTSTGTAIASTAYGTNNFLLASTGTGLKWVDPATLGGGSSSSVVNGAVYSIFRADNSAWTSGPGQSLSIPAQTIAVKIVIQWGGDCTAEGGMSWGGEIYLDIGTTNVSRIYMTADGTFADTYGNTMDPRSGFYHRVYVLSQPANTAVTIKTRFTSMANVMNDYIIATVYSGSVAA